MTPNERIKHLRKQILGLTQEQFADELHITRSSLSVIEIGKAAITRRNLAAICDRYNVHESWILEGKEPIFKNLTREEAIADYIGRLLSNQNEETEFQKRFISVLSKLSVNEWKIIEKITKEMGDKER